MKAAALWSLGGVLWLAALYGSLQVRFLDFEWEHALCGWWGCGPAAQALAAYHLFWLILVAAPVAVTLCFGGVLIRSRLGLALILFAICSVIILAIWETAHWPPFFPDITPKGILQRVMFRVATLIDWPILPCFFGGVILWLTSNRPRRSHATGNPFAARE